MWWGRTNYGNFNFLDHDWQSEQMNRTLSKLGHTSDYPIKYATGVMIVESVNHSVVAILRYARFQFILSTLI